MTGALLTFLTVLLAVLKLAGYIKLSWWLVFTPVIGAVVAMIALMALALWLIVKASDY